MTLRLKVTPRARLQMRAMPTLVGASGRDGISVTRSGGALLIAIDNPNLVALLGLGTAADMLPYFTAPGQAALATMTPYARSLLDDVDAATARATLGLTISADVQAHDVDLDALAALASTGMVARTAAGAAATRTLTAPAAGITVTNGDGVAGNPTLALADDLAAVEGLTTAGIAVRTGASTWATRILTGTANVVTVTNGSGGAGDPTIDIATNAINYARMQDVSATARVLGRKSAGAGDPEELTLSDLLDFIGSAAQGDILYRGAAGWARLAAGSTGQFLKTLGAGANPAWAAVPGGGDMLAANNLSDLANKAAALATLNGFANVKVTKFTAGGTYTPSAGLLYAVIECVGGGGGGGGAVSTAGNGYGGTGGGSGSRSLAIKTAAQIGASQTVTIGAGGASVTAGGDTSVGTLCIGKGGGAGGSFASGSAPPAPAGGVAGTGDVTGTGAPGGAGWYDVGTTQAISGTGGSSPYGGGGGGVVAAAATVNGSAATGYGGGGGGGASANGASGGTAAGGAGSGGIVVIIEFCNQ